MYRSSGREEIKSELCVYFGHAQCLTCYDFFGHCYCNAFVYIKFFAASLITVVLFFS